MVNTLARYRKDPEILHKHGFWRRNDAKIQSDGSHGIDLFLPAYSTFSLRNINVISGWLTIFAKIEISVIITNSRVEFIVYQGCDS